MFKQILLQGLRKARLILVIVSVYAVVCRWMMPPTTTTQLQSIIQGKSVSFRRDYVPIEQVSPDFLLAVIASEDAKFAQHHGIDIDATIYALKTGKGGGASTISQQVSKNVLLWQNQDYLRKLLEIPLTAEIELIWGKRRILEVYVNVIEMGNGIFGIQAASQYYFHKDAANLTMREAATIAALLPNPKKRGENIHSPAMKKRVAKILKEMKYIKSYQPKTIDFLRESV